MVSSSHSGSASSGRGLGKASESKPFAVLGDFDDVDRREMLRRVIGWLAERGQESGNNQLGDIVLVDP